MKKDYEKLHSLSRKARVLQGISYLLDWDQETFMPSGSSESRAEQLELVAGLIHEQKTSKTYANTLNKLIDLKTGKIKAKELDAPHQAALRMWHRDYLIDTSLPKKFVEDFAKLTSTSIVAWRHAKQDNAFQKFAPFLEKIIQMNQKKAELIGYKDHPYDALLDLYEPGLTTDVMTKTFKELSKAIIPIVKGAKPVKSDFLTGNFSQEKQLEFSQNLLKDMGYDLNKGRLDLSAHPFSTAMHPSDSRITTRLQSGTLITNVLTTLHEGGHSLYEMGLPVEHFGTPLCEAVSLGIHESQSRWWETRIGLSRPFWKHYFPKLKSAFNLDVTFEQFLKAANKVEPSLIRVEADEVTYPLHVILRFQLEKALIEGSLSVKDVPEAWNATMKEFLGVTPPNNAKGCLQDIHWAMGAFGYFPTYALGNIYAAQFFEKFEKDHPDWEKQVEKGELIFIKEWLHHAIYRHGRRYLSHELIKEVTGKEFSVKPYIKYLETKFK